MRRSRVLRILLPLVLAAWSLPAAAALGVATHLAAGHHHQAAGHDAETSALAFAVFHGHHHELGQPAHRHDASGPECPSALPLDGPQAAADVLAGVSCASPPWSLPAVSARDPHPPPSPGLPLRL